MISNMEKPSPIYTTREMEAVSPSPSHGIEWKNSDVGSDIESRDPLNPRNWSSARKTLLFVSLMTSSLLADGYAWPGQS